jgi:nitrite reductase/ring-hydroxylating ferredoxin subunit
MQTAQAGPIGRGAWWAAALSEAVNDRKPLAVTCEQEELALFRDGAGIAVALEDRCPHRRVPLTLGSVRGGKLQCAYHGWTFDGASGACTAIPNLAAHEAVPARYGARSFPVHEADGFVHVWLGAGGPEALPLAADRRPTGRAFTGSAVVSLSRHEYLAAMLDGPDALLRFDGVHITDFFLGDARRVGDALVLDRGAVWAGKLPPPHFVTDHPLIVRTAVPLDGGVIRVQLLTADESPVATLHIAASANRRGTTRLCWRGGLHEARPAGAPLRWRGARLLGKPALHVFSTIDGAALAALLVEPSKAFQAARALADAPALFAA